MRAASGAHAKPPMRGMVDDVVPRSALGVVGLLSLALLLSVAAAFGAPIMATGYFDSSVSEMACRAFLFWPAWCLVLMLADHALARRGAQAEERGRLSRFVPEWRKSSVALFAAVMLLFWSAWIVALYPGSMNWDTYYQIAQCYPGSVPVYLIPWAPTGSVVDATFSDHHPIFDTLLFGLFARASDAMFGNWNYGVFCFVVLQSIATAVAFSAGIAYARRAGSSHALCFAGYAAFCLLPFYPAYAATMLKDSIFSVIWIPYFLLIVEVVRTKGSFLGKRSALVWLIVLGILLALTKKTGLYVVFGTAVILLFVYRSHWKAFAAQALSVLLVMQVLLPSVVFPALDVIPGGKQEALAVPFEQTARYVSEHEDDVTDEERRAIDAVLGYDTLAERYEPLCADSVKNMWNYNATTEEMLEYAKVWVAQGLRHPDTYLEAWWAPCAGYFAPGGTLALHEDTGDVEHGGSSMLWRPESLEGFHDAMMSAYHWLCDLPVVGSTLTSVALYAFWVPAMALYVLARRDRSSIPLLVPTALSIACCLITPAFHARYALPLIYTAPLLVCLLGTLARKKPIELES